MRHEANDSVLGLGYLYLRSLRDRADQRRQDRLWPAMLSKKAQKRKMTKRGLSFLLISVMMVAVGALGPTMAEDGPVAVPGHGHPYASSTESGAFFRGTISIEKFVSTGDGLMARGELLFVQGSKVRVLPTTFPVNVLRADCFVLELEIGPPEARRSLEDPLVMLETPDTNPMRYADFCAIGLAWSQADYDEVASLLNEEALLEAGFLGGNSCPWYRWPECVGAITACTAECVGFSATVVGAVICEACLGASTYYLCKDCILSVLD